MKESMEESTYYQLIVGIRKLISRLTEQLNETIKATTNNFEILDKRIKKLESENDYLMDKVREFNEKLGD